MHLLFTSKICLERALFLKKNNLNNHPQSEINNKNIYIQNGYPNTFFPLPFPNPPPIPSLSITKNETKQAETVLETLGAS